MNNLNYRLHLILVLFILTLFFGYQFAGHTKDLFLNYVDENISNPIILIPGLGGTQAYCQLKESKSNEFPIWLNLFYMMIPEKLQHYFGLRFNPTTLDSENTNACNVIFPGWGETRSIEYLHTNGFRFFNYFGPLVNFLEQNKFFIKNFTLRGAPYDFRKLPYENTDFMDKLKSLVEETYKNANRRPVVLLGHSMGSLYTLNFLNKQTKLWKNKYIKSYISVSAPFGGAVKALLGVITGDNFGIFYRTPLSFRPILRSFSSIISTIPDPRIWPSDDVIITTPDKNYTAHNYPSLFQDIGFSVGYQVYKKAVHEFMTLDYPKDIPEVYCVYSSGLLTIKRLIYKPSSLFRSEFPNQSPKLEYEDGDGTVNLQSLQHCTKWPNVSIMHLIVSNHVPILADKRFLQFVQNHVTTSTVSNN
ncbi:unnamed protein product [Schistosoma rodhaini]|nr:unnamed protein product [Schistosoma rodhaini]